MAMYYYHFSNLFNIFDVKRAMRKINAEVWEWVFNSLSFDVYTEQNRQCLGLTGYRK